MKEHIDEINITLNMLDEKPLQIQFNEKKEIEELSTSYNDTQTRSQSLNSKIILDSLNGLIYKDDSQVARLSVHKIYGEVGEVTVMIEQI